MTELDSNHSEASSLQILIASAVCEVEISSVHFNFKYIIFNN